MPRLQLPGNIKRRAIAPKDHAVRHQNFVQRMQRALGESAFHLKHAGKPQRAQNRQKKAKRRAAFPAGKFT